MVAHGVTLKSGGFLKWSWVVCLLHLKTNEGIFKGTQGSHSIRDETSEMHLFLYSPLWPPEMSRRVCDFSASCWNMPGQVSKGAADCCRDGKLGARQGQGSCNKQ